MTAMFFIPDSCTLQKSPQSDRIVDTSWTGKRTNYSLRESLTVKVFSIKLQQMNDCNCSSATLLKPVQHVQ